jgi:hypothetical protein
MHGPDIESHERSSQHKFPRVLLGECDFSGFDMLMAEYNSRDHSFAEDALPGVTGLLAVMSRSFPGGFIYGLPEMSFDSALMWCCVLAPTLSRRTHSGKKHCILKGSQLPSWSWLGWKGLHCHAFLVKNNWELFNEGDFTIRITQWFVHETPESKKTRAIRPTILDHQESNFGRYESDQLPPGWTREKFDPQKHARSEVETDASKSGARGAGKSKLWVSRLDSKRIENIMKRKRLYVLGEYVFRHPNLPHRLFWRPFPITESANNFGMSIPPQYAFISCETKRGHFSVMRRPSDNAADPGLMPNAQLEVLDKSGSCCGYIQPDEFEEFYVPNRSMTVDMDGSVMASRVGDIPAKKPNPTLKIMELVAICLQRRLNGGASINHDGVEIIDRPQFTERYGVLWVEWIGVVAYRKRSGYIQKEIWENYDLEDVHLILG